MTGSNGDDSHVHTRSGQGELRVELVAGESAVVKARASSPLKILVPRSRGVSVMACLASFGGGLVAGDELGLDVEVGDGARCYLSTQASTKVYRNPGMLPCGQTLIAKVGKESVLAMVPDPVQAFGASLYRQRQEFHLEKNSGLLVVDWLSSGRSARGERWAFTRYESRNEIFVGGKRVAVDSLLLDPADGPIEHPSRMGRFNCLALLIMAGGMLAAPAARVLETIGNRPVPRRASLVCSASPLADGALVRIAGEQVEDVRKEISDLLDCLPEILHDDPRQRKW
jgi:urease accessory protein